MGLFMLKHPIGREQCTLSSNKDIGALLSLTIFKVVTQVNMVENQDTRIIYC